MESTEIDDIRQTDWDHVLFSKNQFVEPKNIWRNLSILFAVSCLHIGVIACLFQLRAMEQQKSDLREDALEITFIERTPTSEPVTSASQSRKNNLTQKPRETVARNRILVPSQSGNKDQIPTANLRLSLDNDEWNSSSVIIERNPLKRQHIALAGRDEPFMQGIKLRDKLSPRQKLAMVGKLFGAVEHDPCNEARNRLANGQSQFNAIDLEADLRAIENHCRP